MKFIIKTNKTKINSIDYINNMNIGKGKIIEIKDLNRTHEQNKKMWAMLSDISDQVIWYGRYLTPEDWKHMFSATLRGYDSVPNLDNNGFIVLGKETSKMKVSEMRDMIELMNAFGAEQQVKFTDRRYSDENI